MRRLPGLLFLSCTTLFGHVGSPDVYLEGDAGPYKLFVTVRTPQAIPGVAEVDVRAETPGVRSISAVPLPMSGPGSKFAPVPERLTPAAGDPQFLTGTIWLMAPGSWEVKVIAAGDRGTGTLAVPVPSAATRVLPMKRPLEAILFGALSFLVLGAVAMTGAAVREAKLPAGVLPDARKKRNGWIAMGIAGSLIALTLWAANAWWNAEASSYNAQLYKPLKMVPVLSGSTLTLTLSDPGWLNGNRIFIGLPVRRSIDDLVLDHNHLMHLYVLREPGLDVVYHLHPDLVQGGEFRLALPTMPSGTYRLYADIVHENGFPETLTAGIALPEVHGRALAGDDASGTAPPWQSIRGASSSFTLPDGYVMRWIGAPGRLRARQPLQFRFALYDPRGTPATGMELYMGMVGHAAFTKTDGTVFAHIHPNGTVAMAAYMKAQGMPMDMAMDTSGPVPNVVAFPYGLPSAGRYRIFVQMKHASTIETAAFDATAFDAAATGP